MAAEISTQSINWSVRFHIWVAGAVMLLAAFMGVYLVPHHYVADDKPALHLEQAVPSAFSGWREDPSQAPLLIDPTLQQRIDELYSQTLNRTYVNKSGDRIMLSIAYGRNQNTESTAAHRPEFCYAAQGFIVRKLGTADLTVNNHHMQVMRLDALAGERREPITYWVTLDNETTLPGFRRKLRQLKYGLQGIIVDGMLVRISSIRNASDPAPLGRDFAVQEKFLRELEVAMPVGARSRFFGS